MNLAADYNLTQTKPDEAFLTFFISEYQFMYVSHADVITQDDIERIWQELNHIKIMQFNQHVMYDKTNSIQMVRVYIENEHMWITAADVYEDSPISDENRQRMVRHNVTLDIFDCKADSDSPAKTAWNKLKDCRVKRYQE